MPRTVVTPSVMREYERRIFQTQGVPSLLLMENAGAGVAREVLKLTSPGDRVAVLCGPGNNGGDGYVCARHLCINGRAPQVYSTAPPESLRGDALIMYGAMRGMDIPCFHVVQQALPPQARVIVDALFGIGLNRPVKDPELSLIRWANLSSAPVVAVDIPSGINGETGEIMGEAIKAQVTLTFQFPKPGHLLFPGREHAGELVVTPIGCGDVQTDMALMEPNDLKAILKKRPMDAHKGSFGRGLLIAGSPGYAGAAVMSGMAALKCGIGLLTIATYSSARGDVVRALPEAMSAPLSLDSPSALDRLDKLLSAASCCAIGPGLGRDWAAIGRALELVLKSGLPLVIDADGLNALSLCPGLLSKCGPNAILTPHPGEMSRLTGLPLWLIKQNPVKAARALSAYTGATVLLKGATTVISSPSGGVTFNLSGGPMLAKGGSGDVLTGITLALLGRGLPPEKAAAYGALWLGCAAQSVKLAESGVMARDVIGALGAVPS